MFLGLLRTRPVQIKYDPTGKHYSKKKLHVLNNSIYVVFLVTVLLSLLEERRKVCQTFSRGESQHRLLLTCVQFSLENSRLSKADHFPHTAALSTTAGQQSLLLLCLYCLGNFVCVHVFFILFFHLVTFVFF